MRRLRYLRLLVLGLVPVAACDRPEYSYSADVPISGFGASTSFAGSFSAGGAVTIGGSSSISACLLDQPVSAAALTSQVVSHQLPARPDVYLQVTDAEAAALRAGGSLLPRPAQPANATTPLRLLLNQLLASASDLRRPLIQELINRFQVTRATWPNPWALRLVNHPGSEHMNPVRIRFHPNAWIVRIVDGSPAIVDVNNDVVSFSAATAQPERIAAIYYTADERLPGGVASCETGRRGIALGNEAMVAEFSLGTADILERLDADIAVLEALFQVARPCSMFDKGGVTFHSFTVCQSWRFFEASTEYTAYQWALSNPVESYKPTPQNLASLLQALKDDRFEPDPFVGTPSGEVGSGGATDGGAGGAAGMGQAEGGQGGAAAAAGLE